MNPEELASGVRTVVHVAGYFEELKQSASDLASRIPPQERGFFTPREEDEARALLVSYWQARNALYDLITSLRRDEQLTEARSALEEIASAAAEATERERVLDIERQNSIDKLEAAKITAAEELAKVKAEFDRRMTEAERAARERAMVSDESRAELASTYDDVLRQREGEHLAARSSCLLDASCSF